MIDRRSFLKLSGLLPGWPLRLRAALPISTSPPSIYEELGVRPFINAAGAYSIFGGALMREEVLEGMQEVSRQSVSIVELQEAVGKKIAALLGCEAALITAGCASSLLLATAACLAGKDPEKVRRLPEIIGSKNDAIMQRAHRFEYDHAIRNAGAKIVEIETVEELKAAVSERTAMLFFLNSADSKGKIRREEFARLANGLKIPVLIDAAADLPPVENLRILTRMGYDLVGFSGGKSLRGPQCSGLLLGRKDLIEAAFANDSPKSDSVGRVSKVGKEEIIGLYRALQLFLATDHDAEWKEWERRVAVIAQAVSAISGVRASMVVPEVPHNRPQVRIEWDRGKISASPKDIVAALRSGEPRIELPYGSEDSTAGLDVAVWMLRANEDAIVGRRLAEAFVQRSGGGRA
jgi:D-glucosaminate-6-phosphate ammonia-lyase